MSEERDPHLQAWFASSDDDFAPQPFTQALLAQLQGRERRLRLLRGAALIAACVSACLLLLEFAAPLSRLAALPFIVIELAGKPWTLALLAALACLGALARIARFRLL